jgi:hypothetical protein
MKPWAELVGLYLIDGESSINDRRVSPPGRIYSGKGRDEGRRDDGLGQGEMKHEE